MTLQVVAGILVLAALGGASIVVMRLRGIPRPPTALALLHGAVAATGVALLAYMAYDPGVPRLAQIALGIFVLAALGGAFVFVTYHLKQLPLPIPLILGHGIVALVGVGLLLAATFA